MSISAAAITPKPAPAAQAEPNLPFDVNGSRAAGALVGGATGLLQGSAMAGMMRQTSMMQSMAHTPVGKLAKITTGNRTRTLLMFSGAGALMGANGAEKIRKKLGRYDAFMNADPGSIRQSMKEGPLQGVAVLGGVLGGGSAARYAFASKSMGHSLPTGAKYVARKAAPWAAVGIVGGAVLGAATGAMQKDPTQTWGTMADTLADKKSAMIHYGMIGGLTGVLFGTSVLKAGAGGKAAAISAAKAAAVFGSITYSGSAMYRMTTTGIHAAGGSNKHWQD